MEANIIDGNKLIAEFMGYEILYRLDMEDLKFHSSWDSLMPVVEKIENMGRNTFNDINVTVYSRFEIKHNRIILHWSSNHKYELSLEVLPDWMEGRNASISKEYKRIGIPKDSTKLYALWVTVVEFIKWYNGI